MKYQELLDYLKSFEDVWLDVTSEADLIIFKTNSKNKDKSNIYAVLVKNSDPARISLKCDALLSKKLRDDYETVLPADKLNKTIWNTIICTGQINDEDLKALINLSFRLAS